MLDPQLEPMFARLRDVFPEPLETLEPAEIRGRMDAMVPPVPERPAGLAVDDLVADLGGWSIPIRRYDPAPDAREPKPALLYFHGGGWMWGSIDSHDQVCQKLALDAGVVVFNVGYRLAPEAPFPAQIDDACQSLAWLIGNAGRFNLDPQRIAIGGDSAGAHLATVAALQARQSAGPQPCFQLLFYPGVDTAFNWPSFRENADAPVLSAKASEWIWRRWLGKAIEQRDERITPLHATDATGLPPAMVLVAQYDPLRDEGIAYAEKLVRAGVPVQLRCAMTLPHGYVRAFQASAAVRVELEAAAQALQQALR